MTDPTTEAPDNWHLTKTTSDRGFDFLPPIPAEYGGNLTVSESSAASGPHLWVRANTPVDPHNPHGDVTEAAAMHLTADNALRLAEQIQQTVHDHYQGWPEPGDYQGQAAALSRMLFEARELVDMYADTIEGESGKPMTQARRLVGEIDSYRAGRGWNAHGFGGEK